MFFGTLPRSLFNTDRLGVSTNSLVSVFQRLTTFSVKKCFLSIFDSVLTPYRLKENEAHVSCFMPELLPMHKPEALNVMVLKACLCPWEHVGRFLLRELRTGDRGTCNGSNEAFMWHLSVSPKILARDPHSFAYHTNHQFPMLLLSWAAQNPCKPVKFNLHLWREATLSPLTDG